MKGRMFGLLSKERPEQVTRSNFQANFWYTPQTVGQVFGAILGSICGLIVVLFNIYNNNPRSQKNGHLCDDFWTLRQKGPCCQWPNQNFAKILILFCVANVRRFSMDLIGQEFWKFVI